MKEIALKRQNVPTIVKMFTFLELFGVFLLMLILTNLSSSGRVYVIKQQMSKKL